ncbi:MAG: tetratricopeptide repeat protein [Bacteroidota bacterium]|nr:tetratricopeptide repeat protein [Bacteroidota bacterium]
MPIKNQVIRKSAPTYIIAVIATAFLLSCSTRKNTFISRSYHNLTAHYNILFNGDESFKKGLQRIDDNYKDDYSRILPVFTYGNDELAKSVSSDMDVSIKKGAKVIALHSIKVKPELKKGERPTPAQREFFNKNEYNRWVDDAYLLIGKSHFYKHDFTKAAETFTFMNREFPKEESKYEANIWLARVYNETSEFKEADLLLKNVEGDWRFPKNLKPDLYTTQADYELKQNHYPAAIKALEKALDLTHRKKLKLRYMFILAQLYQQTGQLDKASDMYLAVIKKNPPYEMTFNANINLAGSVETGSKNSHAVREKMLKLLRNDKNRDFQDQIYYALGNLEIKDGNKSSGIEYYKKSVSVSTQNNAQKGLSCLTLANIFYADKNYIPAQAYYDSTLLYITDKYPGIIDIKAKARSLTNLVKNLNAITLEDSLQRVAKLSKAEQSRLVDNIINNIRQKEAEAKQAEDQRLQDYYNSLSRQSVMAQDKTTAAKWYFYNPVSVTQGMKEFQMKWGKRKLEDNWRRRNKNASMFGAETAESVASSQKQEEVQGKKKLDNKSREFYLQNIPANDSMMKASQQKLLDGYYYGGMVYRNELNDLPQAIALYEQMVSRYPGNKYNTAVYYQLYSMEVELKNESKAAYYRDQIISKFPESVYAKILIDPNYYKQIQDKNKEADNFYQQTYSLYSSGNYQQVLANIEKAQLQYKNDKLIPKFELLKAMTVGKTTDKLTYRSELNKLVAKYPDNEVGKYAKEALDYMNNYQPETKKAEDVQVAKTIYSTIETTPFFVSIVFDKSDDINQLVFDIINFNLDNFSSDKLEVSKDALGKNFKMVTIRGFANKDKAQAYYKVLMAKPTTLKSIKGNTKHVFVISLFNYPVLTKQENADSYLEFFKLNFK